MGLPPLHALRRKPQALAASVYRDSLFPQTEYAAALGDAASARRLPPHGRASLARP